MTFADIGGATAALSNYPIFNEGPLAMTVGKPVNLINAYNRLASFYCAYIPILAIDNGDGTYSAQEQPQITSVQHANEVFGGLYDYHLHPRN